MIFLKTRIKIQHNEIMTNLIKNLNILIISDIHIDMFQNNIEYLDNLLYIISNLKIDYILIPGDLIQSNKVIISNVNTLIKEFGKLAPTIISIGNHELQASAKGLDLKWFLNLEKYNNVYPLKNTSILLNDIQFTGFSPSLNVYLPKTKNKDELFLQEFDKSNITIDSKSKFNIMLSHNPNYINKKVLDNNEILNSFNLFVSGHNHNGCTPLFLENILKYYGIFGPYFTLFPSKSRGIIDVNNAKLFISKGFRKFPQENIFMSKLDNIYSNDIHKLTLKKGNKMEEHQ